MCNVDIELMYSYGSTITHKCSIRVFAMITLKIFMIACSIINTSTISLKGGGHANFDAEFFVPMDSLGDA